MHNLINFLRKYNHWILFLTLEATALVLLAGFNNYQGSAFFTSANRVAGLIHEIKNGVTGYFYLRTANQALVEQNVHLQMQVESLRTVLKQRNTDSTALERIRSEALEGYQIHRAKVINSTLTHADNYITLDKGEEDGIHSEMGVVSGTGVVGIVYLTSSRYSIVIPVLNSKCSISCKIRGSDYFGFLTWEGGSPSHALVKDIPRHSLFSLGDTIVTSGHSTVFPGGIPIGTVEDMKDSHDGLSYILQVKLLTDFGCLDHVRVIEAPGREEMNQLEQQVTNQ